MRCQNVFFCLLSCLIFAACKKSGSSSVTSGMGGVRNWAGSYYYQYTPGVHGGSAYTTSYNYADTAFALTIIDGSTVSFLGSSFSFDHSTNHIYYYVEAWEYFEYQSGEGIVYFKDNDSIVYVHGDVHMSDASWTLREIRHTY